MLKIILTTRSSERSYFFFYLNYIDNNYPQTTLVVVISMDILDMDKTKYGLKVIYALLKNEEFALLYRKNLHF